MTAVSRTGTIPPDRRRWATTALWLVAGTMAYNIVEAVVAIWSAHAADSIALLGFGLDSAIETAAAAVLLWRLRVETQGANERAVERTESWVARFVGGTFLALALYVTAQSVRTLWLHEAASESLVGILLAAASLVIMPVVSWAKLRAARRLGSRSLRAEAMETLACSYLSFTLLLGLGANAALGWWWADPVAALFMVPWLVKEGVENIGGEEESHETEQGGDEGGVVRQEGTAAGTPSKARRDGATPPQTPEPA